VEGGDAGNARDKANPHALRKRQRPTPCDVGVPASLADYKNRKEKRTATDRKRSTP